MQGVFSYFFVREASKDGWKIGEGFFHEKARLVFWFLKEKAYNNAGGSLCFQIISSDAGVS